eukprot:TRINITY_DN24542_c0_g1_i1.p1 TRINITY_DN24542_c0_g1~~TRINITY_DN24542_c0_g1_i1.p1  ORF type:complete len:164 (-),score=56.93 TRINITY_DN24542_c0_g1_i1:714-1205(-)
MGVRGAKDGADGESSDEEENKQLSEEEFKQLCQARNESARKELNQRGLKVIASQPIQAKSLPAPKPRVNGRANKEQVPQQASVGYVDPYSAAAQEQAAAEASKWQNLKEESELSAQHRESQSKKINKPNNKSGKGKGGGRNRNRNGGKGRNNNGGKGSKPANP